jgi:serpin B
MKRHPLYNSIVVWILVGFVIGLWGLAGVLLAVGAKGKEDLPQADTAAVIAGNGEFALELYVRLSGDPNARPPSGNLFFSPYSISTALSMTYMGARGVTALEMAGVLHFPTEPIKTLDADSQGRPFYRMCERGPISHARIAAAFGSLERQLNNSSEKGGYELSVANALWGQTGYGFLKEFLTLTKENYGAGLREVDFVNAAEREKARKTINSWVEKETKEKIKDLIPPGVLGALTRLVLTNAVYFKGDWSVEFDKKQTTDAPFKVAADKEVVVPLMYQKGDFKYAQEDRLQILELPYKGDELSMVVLLPAEVDGLAEMEKSLTPKDLNRWLTLLRKEEVHVYLPKFKMTTGPLELKGILKAMGMKDAFSMAADFSGMSGNKDLFISNVLHKAFVAVDEKGTEAAAATAVVVTLKAEPAASPVFRADHPFVFLIKDNRSGSILFMGRVVNPAKQA